VGASSALATQVGLSDLFVLSCGYLSILFTRLISGKSLEVMFSDMPRPVSRVLVSTSDGLRIGFLNGVFEVESSFLKVLSNEIPISTD